MTPSSIHHPPSPPDPFDEAVIRQWTYKTPAMQRVMVAGCRLALERASARGDARPTNEFSANDLPPDLEHGGRGIAGSVFGILARDGVLSPVGWFAPDGSFQQRTVKNAGGNHIGVWRLKSAALARRLLAVHGAAEASWQQAELLAL